ncbi:unnamed protein product [Rhizophagus irregularis]|nr:unnamed protein product [Rhizophagus irregularis]
MGKTHRRTLALTQNWTLRFQASFLVPKNGKEPRFIRSGWLPSSEEQKEPSFVSTSTKLVRPFGFGVSGGTSEFRRMKKKPRFVSIYESWFASSKEWKRTKIRSGRLLIFGKVEPRFVRSGGFPNSEEWKIKIRSDGFPNSEERKIKFCKSGGFPNSEEQKIKIHKIGWIFEFQSTEKNQDSFWVDFQRSEEKEPRFVSSGRLPSSGKQKKIKIRLGGFSTNG